MAHGVFGQRGNRQRGIDAEVGPKHSAITDIEVVRSKHPPTTINHTVISRFSHSSATHTMCGDGDIEPNFGDGTAGNAANTPGQSESKVIGLGNIGGNFSARDFVGVC